MLFNARGSITSIPALEVPGWVYATNTEIKMESFLATLIMYDAGTRTCYSLAIEKLLVNLLLKPCT